MGRVPVSDLAEALGIQICDVIRELHDLGITVNGPGDAVAKEIADALLDPLVSHLDGRAADGYLSDVPHRSTPDSPPETVSPATRSVALLEALLEEARTMNQSLRDISAKLDDVATSSDLQILQDTLTDVDYEVWRANENRRPR